MINIYNTLTKKKEPLTPLEANKIGIYVCGLTVYDYCHVGNARVFLTFDVIIRYLIFCGYEVFYVRNITDIDDKIINRAQVLNITITELTARFIQAMHDDFESLGLLAPNLEPRASANIPEMIAMIATLISNGYAYVSSDGDVYYEVNKFKDYGKLAHQNLDDLIKGARVEVNLAKRNALDFVLWKKSKPGEPAWPSPWGDGRPGWHIECSVMANLHVGAICDIHGGGMDLKFPHHQNEIAQSEAAFGHKTVNTWMHVGFVEINKEKMSKSLGNFFTLREVLKTYHPEVIRYFLLSSHYRSPLNYSVENLDQALSGLIRLYTALSTCDINIDFESSKIETSFKDRFCAAMNDDFNTPEALALLFDLARELNRLNLNDPRNSIEALRLAKTLKYLANILGLLKENLNAIQRYKISLDINEIDGLIALRNDKRKAKKWHEADKIRDQLLSMGIELEDSENGTHWHPKAK